MASMTEPGASSGRFLTKLTVIATLGGLLFGYDTGVISGALLYMKDDLHLSSFAEATVVSSLLFPGAALGALFGGRIADRIGRKRTLVLCACVFLVGALGCALAPTVEIMVAARIVLGFGVGAASVTCPLYLAEMAPPDRRGRMVTINELMIVTGQMLAFAMNALLDHVIHDPHVWRIMLAVAAVPAVALLLGMMVLPDSPRWYGLKGRLPEARRVLGLSLDAREAKLEFDAIVEHAERTLTTKSTPFSVIRDVPWIRRVVLIGCGLAIVQQATGINTVNYYAPTILEQSGLGVSASLIATIAVGVTSVVTTIIGIVLLGFVGRRTMLLTGFAGVAGSQFALSLTFLLPESTYAQLHHPRLHGGVRRLRADVHRDLRVAIALGDLPAQHPRLRDGHRRVRAVVHQRADLLPVPRAELATGFDGNLRAVRRGQHRVVAVRAQVRARDEGHHPRGTRGPVRSPGRRAGGRGGLASPRELGPRAAGERKSTPNAARRGAFASARGAN